MNWWRNELLNITNPPQINDKSDSPTLMHLLYMKWVKTISSFESVKCLFDTAAGKVWKCQKEFQRGNEIFNLRWKFFISYQPKKETISSSLLRSKGLGEGSRIDNLSCHSWQFLTNCETETMIIMKVTGHTESDTWTVFAINLQCFMICVAGSHIDNWRLSD